ncbi:MAG: hypothetical protein ACM31C_19455 [Acidobacteriota bacterium]
MWRAIVGLSLLAACNGAQLHDAIVDGGGGAKPDSSGTTAIDAPSSSIDAPADAATTASCNNGRVVYLNFDGVTITQAATSDATQNLASWIGVTTANVPPYHSGNTNRAAQITNITTTVQSILSQYPITVVTTRPAAGPYVMIAFGGTNQTVGSNYTYATSYHDCGDLVKSDVGWVSDTVPNSIVANTAVGTIGWSLGLQGTTDSNDCMCAWASTCTPSSTPCTLGTNETTGTSKTPATTCPGLNPQNEQAAFHAAFCQ